MPPASSSHPVIQLSPKSLGGMIMQDNVEDDDDNDDGDEEEDDDDNGDAGKR